MTGEITLRGRVLPIGGLKEKLLAAKIGNIKKVLIPKGNVPDLKKISKEIILDMEIVPVESADQVLREALELTNPEEFLSPRRWLKFRCLPSLQLRPLCAKNRQGT